jgi:two-component system phosphate regulon sensor histidine kinase PhoR
LKKIFTTIFILISISLVGIIYIQWNLITTMVEKKEEELQHKIVDVTRDVVGELIEYKKAPFRQPVASDSQGSVQAL